MLTINKQQLIDKLQSIKSAMPIGFSSITAIGALKKNRITKLPNPYGEIFKLSKVNAFISFDYENSVNNRRVREGKEDNFTTQDRTWGERIGPNLITHKGNYYLQCKVEKARKPIYFIKDRDGMLRIIDKSKVIDYLPTESKSNTQELDKEVIVRTYKLSNINILRLSKETYKLQPTEESAHKQPIKTDRKVIKQLMDKKVEKDFRVSNKDFSNDQIDQSWDAHKNV